MGLRIKGMYFSDLTYKIANRLIICRIICGLREIHPLDPQPNRHSMLVPRVCAPRVTRFSLGRYWSRDLCSKQAAERLTGWLGIQTVIISRSDRLPRRWDQQAANPGVHRLSMTHRERQRNLMMHAQCPLPVYYSQLGWILVIRYRSWINIYMYGPTYN